VVWRCFLSFEPEHQRISRRVMKGNWKTQKTQTLEREGNPDSDSELESSGDDKGVTSVLHSRHLT